MDKSKWPAGRKWKVESDYATQEDKEKYLQELRDRADGQYVKTYVADHWTFEYDLAYSGLLDELIEAIVTVKYIERNRETKKKDIIDKLCGFTTLEQKASYLYHFFSNESTSKAEVAQQIADILERKYKDNMDELKNKLPQYIKDAINYVT